MKGSTQHERSALRSMVGMLTAPVVWAIHFAVTYSLVAVACTAQIADVRFLGLTAVQLILLAAAAVSIMAIGAAANVARGLQHGAAGAHTQGDEQARRRAYLGRTGTLLSIVFVALILIETLPVFLLDPCRRAP